MSKESFSSSGSWSQSWNSASTDASSSDDGKRSEHHSPWRDQLSSNDYNEASSSFSPEMASVTSPLSGRNFISPASPSRDAPGSSPQDPEAQLQRLLNSFVICEYSDTVRKTRKQELLGDGSEAAILPTAPALQLSLPVVCPAKRPPKGLLHFAAGGPQGLATIAEPKLGPAAEAAKLLRKAPETPPIREHRPFKQRKNDIRFKRYSKPNPPSWMHSISVGTAAVVHREDDLANVKALPMVGSTLGTRIRRRLISVPRDPPVWGLWKRL